jgi:hypothetical protein
VFSKQLGRLTPRADNYGTFAEQVRPEARAALRISDADDVDSDRLGIDAFRPSRSRALAPSFNASTT